MENKNKENAFPALHLNAHQGMTLRDYFAAKVITSVWQTNSPGSQSHLARVAYKIADAMLKQREKNE